jgi:hypothetical protein
MKRGLLGALAFSMIGTGLVRAQAPAPTLPPPSPQAPRPTPSGVPGYPVAGDTQGGTTITISPPPPLANGQGCLPPETFLPSGGPVFYSDLDFLMYRFRAGAIPSTARVTPIGLITVGVTNTITNPVPPPPVISQPVTTVLPVSIINNAVFGNGSADFSTQHGGRLALGFWCDPEETWGLEARAELVEKGNNHFGVVTGVSPNSLVINTGVSQTTTFVVTSAGGATTTFSTSMPVVLVRQTQSSVVGLATNEFESAELNARGVFLRYGCTDIGGLVGLRYLMYKDEIGVIANSRLFLPPGATDMNLNLPAPSRDVTFNTVDNIRIRNNFFGAQAGLDLDVKFGSFFLDVRGTLALGDMHQTAEILGNTQIINNDPAVATHPTPATVSSAGGLLSSPADNGLQHRDRFSYVPEVNAKLGCQLTSWFRAWVGYDGLLLGHVARSADSTVTNTLTSTVSVGTNSTTATIAQPAFRFQDRDVWVQGLTFGCELRY